MLDVVHPADQIPQVHDVPDVPYRMYSWYGVLIW
jgi:hypothetical protein